MNEHSASRRERIWRYFVLVNVGALLVGLILGLVVRYGSAPQPGPNRSTFERETPRIENWPRHRRPFPRA